MVFCFASAAQSKNDGTMPLYDRLTGMSASLKINSIGYANAQGTAATEPGYNVAVTVELQQFDDGWTTIKSYTSSGSGVLGAKPYIKMFVSHGMYQAKVTAKVTDANGKHIETQTAFSQVVTY